MFKGSVLGIKYFAAKYLIPRTDPLRALGNKNFRLFFFGQLISLTGTWMQIVAQSWLVYRLSDSAFLLGLTAFFGRIPIFIFGLPAGIIADRVSRHRLVILTQALAMLQAAVLAYLTLTNRISVIEIIIISAIWGTIMAVDMPARQAFIAQIVTKENLPSAIGLNSSAVNLARIVGPAIAGIIVVAAGEGFCFLINAISYLAILTGLISMKISTPKRDQWEGFRRAFSEAAAFIRHNPNVSTALLLLGAASFSGMSQIVIMPVVVGEILHKGSDVLGALMAASGVGAVIGAIMLARKNDGKNLLNYILVCMLVLSISLFLLGCSNNYIISIGIMVCVGFGMITTMASTNTYLQSIVPDELRGRIMSVYTIMFAGITPFGGLFTGTLAHTVGASLTLQIGAVLILLAILIGRTRLPRGQS